MSDYMQEAVEAAAQALEDHSWMTFGDWESLCACGEVLKPSLEYAGDAYRSHLATVALTAAEPYLRKKWVEGLSGPIRAIKVERPRPLGRRHAMNEYSLEWCASMITEAMIARGAYTTESQELEGLRRALAAHDREVAAKTLRNAADGS